VTSMLYRDCKEGFKCEEPTPGAPGACLEKNCVEMGGAQNYCAFGQFCCGEDRDKDTKADPCVDATGKTIAQVGKCYDNPNPPWCQACEAHADCTKNGAPASTKDFNLCIAFGADKNGADRGNSCMYACATAAECPKGFLCNDIPVDCSADPATCGDATRCYDTGKKDGDGNPIKWCKCTSAGQRGGECPILDPGDPSGPVSRCMNASGTLQLHCIWTRGCYPNPMVCTVP